MLIANETASTLPALLLLRRLEAPSIPRWSERDPPDTVVPSPRQFDRASRIGQNQRWRRPGFCS